jgi:hypothetical protein
METKYFDYIKLIYPFKEDGTHEKFFKIVGECFDWLAAEGYKARDHYYIHKDDFEGLVKHANERGLSQLRNESNDLFRDRVYFAYLYLSELSTKKGVENTLKNICSKPFAVIEWFAVEFILDESLLDIDILGDYISCGYTIVFSQALTADERQSIIETLEIIKPVHIGYYIQEP